MPCSFWAQILSRLSDDFPIAQMLIELLARRLSMIPEVLLLVKQIRPRTSEVDDLRTPVPIFLKPCTFEAVERVRDTLRKHDH